MRYFLPVSIAVLLLGCGDGSGPSSEIPAELAGTWQASPACLPQCGFTLVRIDNPADSVNFVSGLQQTFVLTMSESGRFGLTALGGAGTIQGRVREEAGLLILRDQEGTQDTADYTLAGDDLALRFRNVTEQFDFDSDGTGDPSTVKANFRRQ